MSGVPVGREPLCPAYQGAEAHLGIAECVGWGWIQSRTILQVLELEFIYNQSMVQGTSCLSFPFFFIFFFPSLIYLGYFWLVLFVTWLERDELLQYAYSWKLQLLWRECQPACWWAHLLYFICFVIQIFLRPFLSIYSQSSCAISIWVQMASVLIIMFLTATCFLWEKGWLLPFVSLANTTLFNFVRLRLSFG